MGVILVEETKGHPEPERNEPLKFLRSHDNGKQTQVDFFLLPDGYEANINFGGLWLGEKNSVIGFREITKELG